MYFIGLDSEKIERDSSSGIVKATLKGKSFCVDIVMMNDGYISIFIIHVCISGNHYYVQKTVRSRGTKSHS